MSDRALRLVLAAPVLATIGIAAYLLQARYSDGSIVCSTGGCETVAESRYSDVFGIPVALVGLLGSVAILATLVGSSVFSRAACLALASTGLIFATYLVLVQLVALHAVCDWCVANDSLVAVIAVLAAVRGRADRPSRPAPAAPHAGMRRFRLPTTR